MSRSAVVQKSSGTRLDEFYALTGNTSQPVEDLRVRFAGKAWPP
jgi:hypothetical protein